ncbi:3-carboxy-cis,cis-muconate cycloisomerase [Pantoea allii]|uniref:3-carboxy-cis,cis-muconate cycloisomerase n=1 Tax=Pantoea allii TaxID=574096 RepID=A0A2V2BM45_9GAMM|nr:3-carboxy-cis,cis-muconate cycloisomerase [Pantoea allii]MBW1215094.1 3-carboxy-cis,cis-muconate cycloisomerase [Pantoea allii]MBW1252207.1 3-carboxy-cis,cis-muconate cycloisomerase [Pantoea allii]MBW1258539.1 3-carboxy-cis,cis-muconate cycloisomerase [Pantoea allii]MBW1261487.1 3-carboxy-cis,cis-muconate cycloisomerase [Pantoea allii]MBW1267760.1 3-carboxy-cis,cis-muconate cycloisomerase [Pantoea allii]
MSLYRAMFMASPLSDSFSDTALLQGMLDFEAGLAQALAVAGVIDHASARCIQSCCRAQAIDRAALTQAAGLAGNLAIPLVKQLTAVVAATSPDAARYVHWGATSQDAIDSGLMLQLRAALNDTAVLLDRLIAALVLQCERHSTTLMVGRTWLQHALPVTLGLKLAGTLDALVRFRARLVAMRPRVLALQFGGAAGTLASLGEKGERVEQALSEALDLPRSATPWHAQRDRITELAGWYAGLTGTLGKLARDMSLLMQSEVGEVSEPQAPGRGGSSTMPHKRNPVLCAAILSAANRVPALMSGLYAGQVQEHERALGGWQAEWQSLPQLTELSGAALVHSTELIDGLEVHEEAMQRNLGLTQGLIMAEAVTLALGESLGRQQAHHHIEQCCRRALETQQSLLTILCADDTVVSHLSRPALETLLDPATATGSASRFIHQVLAAARES